MYQKMSDACKKGLKHQFDFSKSELDQIESFISNNMGKRAREILETLMEDNSLNDRQKVMVSYTLGASVGAESAIQDLEKINTQKVMSTTNSVMNIHIGQGG
jgi:hypothetical protein